MRRNPTDAERVLWQLVRAKRLGVSKWKRQQPLGPYIVDFVCFERCLVVEADGGQHADSQYDLIRDKWLRSQGFDILRFWNDDILFNPEGVVTAILVVLSSGDPGIEPGSPLTPLPGPPPQGGRESMETICG